MNKKKATDNINGKIKSIDKNKINVQIGRERAHTIPLQKINALQILKNKDKGSPITLA